jgi:hypothetical protein
MVARGDAEVRCNGCDLVGQPTRDWTVIEFVDGSRISYCASCTREPVEPVDDVLQPHPFRHPTHCATCCSNDPYHGRRRETKPWNGRM